MFRHGLVGPDQRSLRLIKVVFACTKRRSLRGTVGGRRPDVSPDGHFVHLGSYVVGRSGWVLCSMEELAVRTGDPLVQSLTELLGWLQREGYSFRTVTPATHARVNARPGTAVARTLRDVFGWSRPFPAPLLPVEITDALAYGGLLKPDPDSGLLRSEVRVSTLEGHLFAHSAYPTVDSDAVFFGPDTDRFVHLILDELARSAVPPGGRILDLGCGAGPGGIVAGLRAASERPRIWLSDINRRALAFASANASHAGCDVECCRSDLLDAIEGEFDLIVSNPPYLNDATERDYRHGGGRWGGALSLRIVREALPRLKPGGRLILYTGSAIVDGADSLREQIAQELARRRWNWRYRELDPDVFGEELDRPAYQAVDRLAAVALVVQRPGEPMRWHLHPAIA